MFVLQRPLAIKLVAYVALRLVMQLPYCSDKQLVLVFNHKYILNSALHKHDV